MPYFSVPSHLSHTERVKLYRLAINKSIILEIGSYVGASACCFGMAVKRSGYGKIFCIDTWNNNAMSEGSRDTWIDFQENTKEFKEHIIPIRGYSTDVVGTIQEQASSVDLLFIDGDHSYEGVKADWEAYKSFLKPGSTVVFHDYGWADGVKRVVHEDVIPMVSSYDSLRNMWWGTLSKSS